jgi:glycosyltransferase involved in cell wall biosynthesis
VAKLKICFFTSYFYPENFKGNDIAFELSKRGHDITVITSIPNYPQGHYYKGYTLVKLRKEMINNVKVIRLPVIPRGSGKKIGLILNYFSYLVVSVCFTEFFLLDKNFDVVFVQQLSPFFVAIPALIMANRQKIPLYLWVLDLWPESIRSAGGANNEILLNILNRIVVGVYKKSTNILIGSRGYERAIKQKGNFEKKIIYFPNWAEDSNIHKEIINVGGIAPFHDFTKDDFILLFAGNLGEAQNLDMLIEAANLVREIINIKWVFVGDGRRRVFLKNKVRELSLEKNVFFPGRFPLETMPSFMKMADILLVSLKDEEIFNLTVPAKVQYYMSQGKPVLAMLNGDGADLIAEANCGFCVSAGDYIKCAEVIKIIYTDRNMLRSLGLNGKEYYEKYFSKKDRIDQLEKLIKEC